MLQSQHRDSEFPATLSNLVRAADRILRRRRKLPLDPLKPKIPKLDMPEILRSHDRGIDPLLQQIIDARLRGESYAVIGKRMGVVGNTVRIHIVHAAIDESLKQKILGSVRAMGKAAGVYPPHANSDPDRAVKLVELRKQGLTLRGVGKQIGISGERVRQIIAAAPPELRATAPKTVKVRKPSPPWRIDEIRSRYGSFRKLVCRWLLLIDHAYCALGHHAVPAREMMGKSADTIYARCRACGAAHQTARYHAEDGRVKAYNKRYQAEHPEVQKRAMAAWARRRWQKIKSDPVKLAAFNAKQRDAYRHRKGKRSMEDLPAGH